MAVSCDRPVLYDYVAVNPHGWLTTDTLRFTLSEVPRDGDYTLSLGARYNNLLLYEDIWLVLEQRNDSRHRDTLHLATPMELPTWQSNGTALHEAEAAVTTAHLTTQQMPVELLVYHVMRHQRLTGIMEVGVRVQ